MKKSVVQVNILLIALLASLIKSDQWAAPVMNPMVPEPLSKPGDEDSESPSGGLKKKTGIGHMLSSLLYSTVGLAKKVVFFGLKPIASAFTMGFPLIENLESDNDLFFGSHSSNKQINSRSSHTKRHSQYSSYSNSFQNSQNNGYLRENPSTQDLVLMEQESSQKNPNEYTASIETNDVVPWMGDAYEKAVRSNLTNIESHVHDKNRLIRKGSTNAKKNLFTSSLLSRAYLSTSAKNALQNYGNASRSIELLGDLVRRGLITPESAIHELKHSFQDADKEKYALEGMRVINNASKYLMKTSAGTVTSIVDGLGQSPSSTEELMSNFPKVLSGTQKKLARRAGQEMKEKRQEYYGTMDKWLTPKKQQKIGKIWATNRDKLKNIKSQWKRITVTVNNTKKYRKRFTKITNNLANVLDALLVRLGDDAELEIMGIDNLRERFNSILAEIKKKNDLAISGKVTLNGLLLHSIGSFGELEQIDRIILGAMDHQNGSTHLRHAGKERTSIENHRRSSEPFNHLTRQTSAENQRYTGKSMPYNYIVDGIN
ncbi:hypothetical protein NEFER03_1721 [Nematocida sp. LUAm3]|nr:hypothetical protein NEFER03_1721 [Nematocida sp. LUAm3]KAI5175711.1 hypothetical protein NEFER02_1598 [Nematocida sp. LUAm2]KAI5178617.1 hypothetical protein NEFER01_1753 [Nematocida sp. LUAm1]